LAVEIIKILSLVVVVLANIVPLELEIIYSAAVPEAPKAPSRVLPKQNLPSLFILPIVVSEHVVTKDVETTSSFLSTPIA